MYALVLAAIVAVGVAPPDGAKLFNDNCTACHTIGGGDGAGPDLIKATQFPRDGIRKAVARMQDNVGPLKPDQIDALVAFLQSKAPAGVAPAPRRPPGSPQIGRSLFFGEETFVNHGTPCFACHAVAGRGGNLAVDLTGVYETRGEDSIVSTAQSPGIPLMKAAYAAHPVTDKEASHLAAFLKAEGGGKPPHSKDTAIVHGAAAGIAAFVFAGVFVAFRRRR